MSRHNALPMVKTQTWWARLWRPFWVLPMAICALSFVAGIGLPLVDAIVGEHLPYVFQGGHEGARSLLSTIATAMISVTGLVFSITMVVLQLASSQFTPRVLGTALQSRVMQATLGVFTASFIYALTVQRSVRGGDQQEFVPQLSVTLAFLLVVASVGMFMAFIHHITTTIQMSQIISRVGEETVEVVRAYFPEPDRGRSGEATGSGATSLADGGPRRGSTVTSERRHGHVAQINYDTLSSCASRLHATIEVLVQVGSFVTEDQPLVKIWDAAELPDNTRRTIARAVTLDADRAAHQDPAFGIRQLVDIAERALSPGVNDPTSATQVVDELHRILRVLVQRETPQAVVDTDDGGRILHRPQTVPELLSLALEEIVHYGEDTVQIPTRLRVVLTDLLDHALPPYRALIRRWLDVIPEWVPREARP